MDKKISDLYKKLKINRTQCETVNEDFLSILNIEGYGKIGITSDGFWAVYTESNVFILDKTTDFLYCLVILETPLNVIKARLRAQLDGILSEKEIYDLFPFTKIIQFALEYNKSDYWLNLAFNWLTGLDTDDSDSIRNTLEILKNDLNVSQKTRHQARKLCKRYRPI